MKKFSVFSFVLVLMLVLDQAVKIWTRNNIVPHGQATGAWPWPGVFEITLTYNQGIAFGLFQHFAIMMTPIAVAIAGGAAWYSFKHPQEGYLSHVAMGLLASGAIGNLYDRLVHKQVTDMFWFRAINFPVFNVADACITVATILLIITWWGDAVKHHHKEAAVESPPAEAVRPEPEIGEAAVSEGPHPESPLTETSLAADE